MSNRKKANVRKPAAKAKEPEPMVETPKPDPQTYNKVMDAIENFEKTLEIEKDSIPDKGAWNWTKRKLYQIAQGAVFCSKKGLEYLYQFLVWAQKKIKEVGVKDRLTRAWKAMTQKHANETPEIAK